MKVLVCIAVILILTNFVLYLIVLRRRKNLAEYNENRNTCYKDEANVPDMTEPEKQKLNQAIEKKDETILINLESVPLNFCISKTLGEAFSEVLTNAKNATMALECLANSFYNTAGKANRSAVENEFTDQGRCFMTNDAIFFEMLPEKIPNID